MSDVKISQFPYVGNTGYTPNDLFVFVNYLNPTGTTSNTKIDDFKNFTIIDSYNYFLPLSGGSVTGSTTFTNGLTANTISATTYQNLPKDIFVTGGTYSNGSTTFTNNTGGTFTITGFSTTTPFTGGTVSGATTFTNGLTANTISATTYQNLPIDPDTFTTGYTYNENTFTIKQNNGQPDLTATINSVTGMTVNGDLTVTGNTSMNAVTATTINSGTVTVTNTSGTPSQAASFDSTGKLVAGLGQTTFTSFGSATLSVTSAVTTFTVLPGITQTITVPSNCRLLITADGGMNTTSTSATAISSVDVAIFIDGNYPTNGGYKRVTAFNPSSTAINNTGQPWSITTIQNLSAGSHTIDVRSVYVIGSTASVSSNNSNSRQGGLYITIIKN